MNIISKLRQWAGAVLLAWVFLGARGICPAQDANPPAPAQDQWENSVLAVPFQCEKGAPEEDAYIALAAHNVVENMLALHNGLEERWAAWTLKNDFPSEAALREFVFAGGALPAEISKEKARYFLFGRLPAATRMLIISPDSRLNFVSFATLLDEGDHFLAEKYSIHYVSTGRDLLRELPAPARSEALVFANPDFANKPAPLVAQNEPPRDPFRGNEKRGILEMVFDSLDGTQKESDDLSAKFAEWKWPIHPAFLRSEASKEALLKVKSPYILHLATHGFFDHEIASDDQRTDGPLEPSGDFGRKKFFANPMHCSGLALAGAQTTVDAWKRGDNPPVENNGILTAEDVSTLDLKGTWLVTLSACDTGSGEAKAGEGVLGLRRGFIQAGAQNLLMTLWPISDQTTAQIMLDFYEAAHTSGNAPQALAAIQRDWLVKLRKEKGLNAAVTLAGPFIMSSQGKP